MKTNFFHMESCQMEAGEKVLLDRQDTETTALGHVTVLTGERTKEGLHPDEEEIYVILHGRALLMLGDEQREVSGGDVIYVPRNTRHQMQCLSLQPLEYLYFANWPAS